MSIKTPNFWRKRNIISYILWPLGLLYWIGFKTSWMLSKKRKFNIKIICIGNLTAGGAGKTPVAIAIGKMLKKEKVKFAYLSSGYGGLGADFLEINERLSYKEVGDEPLLLSEIAPTFVSNDRVRAIKKIEEMGYDLVVLDDGMQDGRIVKDLLMVVIDGKIKFGNGFLMPAGPLRSRIARGLNIANRIIIVGEIDKKMSKIIEKYDILAKIINAKVEASNLKKYQGKKVFAFCGLAYPEKFFDFLTANQVDLVDKKAFADHYDYKNYDLDNLIKISEKNGAKLLATKKDWIKFSNEYRKKIDFLDIDFTFKEENVIVRDLKNLI